MKNLLFAICTWSAVCALTFTALLGQTEKAQLSGTITDNSDAAIPGAGITVVNSATGIKRITETNGDGHYVMAFLDPSVYAMVIQKQGFQSLSRSGIKLDVAQVTILDFTLGVGNISETVNVTSRAPLLDTGSSTLGHLIENNDIVNLPINGRNSYSFAALVRGVRTSPGFTQVSQNIYNDQFISINGSRPNQKSFLLDGGINSTSSFNGPSFFPSIDVVQEYKVQTNNFSAEFSDTTGGVVNVVTKSGTNKFHGKWKLHFARNSATEKGRFTPEALFELERDPAEKYDASKQQPQDVTRLTEMAAAFYRGIRPGAPCPPLPPQYRKGNG
jgi:hypothetical protein